MFCYIREHCGRIVSLSAFLLLFYFSACGILSLKAQSEMKCKRCFVSQLYPVE